MNISSINILLITWLILITSYLIGSISFGLISAKLFKLQDPRTFGSKNIGATNILRSGNKKAAICTLVGDLLKGYVVVIMAMIYGENIIQGVNWLPYACAVAVFMGHIFPLWLKFKGGKGVATSAGVLIALQPIIGIYSTLAWLIIAVIFRYSSLAAIAAAFTAILASFLIGNNLLIISVLIIGALILFKHRTNIKNLINGSESKIKIKS